MKIGWKIRKLWHFEVSQIFTKHFLTSRYEYANEWVDAMSSPHYLPYILYIKCWKFWYFAQTCDSKSLISRYIGVNIILHLFREELRQEILIAEIWNFCHFCYEMNGKLWGDEFAYSYRLVNVSWKFAKLQNVITYLFFNRFSQYYAHFKDFNLLNRPTKNRPKSARRFLVGRPQIWNKKKSCQVQGHRSPLIQLRSDTNFCVLCTTPNFSWLERAWVGDTIPYHRASYKVKESHHICTSTQKNLIFIDDVIMSFVLLKLSRLPVINFSQILICCNWDNSLQDKWHFFHFDDVIIVKFSIKGDNA